MANRFTDSGLAPTSQHTYAVLAVDGAGNKSATATVVGQGADTTPPSIPTGLTATPFSQTQINLTWNASTDTASGVAGYRVYRDGVLVGSPTALAYSDTGLGVGSNHTYRVAAIDVAGNLSAQCTAVAQSTPDQTAPSVPAGLTATVISSTEIDLSWNASTDVGVGIAGYRLYRAGVQIVQQAGRTYANTGLTASTQYSYQISAYDSAGNESAKSTAVLATTQSGGSLGALVHGQSFTVTGSGFGAQSGGVVVRDYGQDPVGTLNGAWTKGWPNSSTVASANIQNQLVSYNPTGAAVGAPHALVSKFTCGAHYTTGTMTSSSCYNVCLAYGYTAPAKPYCFYIHAFERNDNNWTFNIGSPPDNNYKQTIDFTGAAGPYDGSNGVPNWDQTAQNFPSNNTAGISYSFDDGAGDFVRDLENPDANGHNLFWGSGASPWQGWIDKETRMGVTDQTGFAGGYIQTWELGATASRKVNYVGSTDRHPGSGRMIVIGGYTRNYPAANNYRYFADLFVYISGTGTFNPTLVFVCDQSTYAASALRIPQVPTSWTDTEVKFNFWQGKAALGQSAYVIVQDVSGGEHSYGPYQISAPVTFDYFISTTGNDANNGLTPATAWAITSLRDTSSHQSAIAGKTVGLVAGVYNISAMTSGSQPTDYQHPVLHLPPGTAANPTKLVSCDASGNYSVGAAIIRGPNASANPMIGQNSGYANYYFTLDGLELDGNGWAGAPITNAGGSYTSAGTKLGFVVQNCHIHGLASTPVGQNQALIYNAGSSGALIRNCRLHAAHKPAQPDHCHAYLEYGSQGTVIEYCTIYDCDTAVHAKAGNSGTEVRYNYIYGCATCAIQGMDGAEGNPNSPGTPYLIHHNVIENCGPAHATDINGSANQGLYWYNNTIYDTRAASGPLQDLRSAKANVIQCYNNIVRATANTGGGSYGSLALTSGGVTVCNYNDFSLNSYTAAWGLSSVVQSTLAAWRTASGFDMNSVTSDPAFVTTPIVSGAGAAQFKLAAGSACRNAGRVGGTSGGAVCDMGAWDGTVTQIGAL